MNVLDNILAHKAKEVEERKALFPTKLLEQSLYFPSDTVSLKKYIVREDKSGIIAEIKRQSPSKGVINPHVSVERTSIGYMQAGASALSVLTDKQFFGGSSEDLMTARKFNFCPILRKDFIIDEYQVIEAKSIGADAILLIAAALPEDKLVALAKMATSLGLETLMEVHQSSELYEGALPHVGLVGVNNRNLATFEVDIENSVKLASKIPDEIVKISESGISSPEAIAKLRGYGYQGFLMGENFMKHSRPHEACASFIKSMQNTKAKATTT